MLKKPVCFNITDETKDFGVDLYKELLLNVNGLNIVTPLGKE